MEPHVVNNNNNNNGSAVLPFDLYGLSNDLQCTCGHIFIVFKIKRDTGRKTPIIHTRLPFDSYGLSESLIFYPPKIFLKTRCTVYGTVRSVNGPLYLSSAVVYNAINNN